MTDTEKRLAEALRRLYGAFEMLMEDANLGASAIRAETIREMNEAPMDARRVLAEFDAQGEEEQ